MIELLKLFSKAYEIFIHNIFLLVDHCKFSKLLIIVMKPLRPLNAGQHTQQYSLCILFVLASMQIEGERNRRINLLENLFFFQLL